MKLKMRRLLFPKMVGKFLQSKLLCVHITLLILYPILFVILWMLWEYEKMAHFDSMLATVCQ